MRRVCGWCRKELDPGAKHNSEAPVSHGICSPCALKMTTGTPRSVSDMLDILVEPVFLVDSQGVLHASNRSGCTLVGKEQDAIVDRLLGDVIECANAGLPGGCGHTVHCSMCTLRNTLIGTLETGQGAVDVPATRNINAPDGERDVHFLISAEQVDGRILLKILPAEPQEAKEN